MTNTQSPIPNTQSPIPNTQSPISNDEHRRQVTAELALISEPRGGDERPRLRLERDGQTFVLYLDEVAALVQALQEEVAEAATGAERDVDEERLIGRVVYVRPERAYGLVLHREGEHCVVKFGNGERRTYDLSQLDP
jgi:hypothetical protein